MVDSESEDREERYRSSTPIFELGVIQREADRLTDDQMKTVISAVLLMMTPSPPVIPSYEGLTHGAVEII